MDNDKTTEQEELYIPFEKPIVDAVDYILQIANENGSQDTIQSSKDWDTIRSLYNIWATLYPEELNKFKESIAFFKQYEDSTVSKESGAMVGHKLEVPQHLHQLISVIFRNQNWDKQFVAKLTTELPELHPSEGNVNA